MKTIKSTEIRKFLESKIGEDGIVIGLRCDNHIPVKKFRKSWNREDGTKVSRKNGVCATYLCEYTGDEGSSMWGLELPTPSQYNAVFNRTSDYGNHMFLIWGYNYYRGQDETHNTHEIVIKDHQCLLIDFND